MPNKKINQLDTRSVPSLSDYLVVADPSTGYAYKELGSTFVDLAKATLVPYTGATASLNLGAYNLTATQIIKVGGTSTQFLKADGSVDSTTYMNRAVYDTDADGIVDAAMAMRTIGRNATGATLYKGTVVYISGSTGNRPNFVKAQANSEATSAGTFGVVYADIANNADGYVVTIGTIDTLDTRTTATNPFTSVTLADGDTVYLDPNTAGYITNVKPSAPNHLVYVGKVTRTSPTNGTIVYRIQNGYELDEIHDVAITSKANNDVLVYESATTLWKNKSIETILGYTPQAAITLTTTGSSGAATFVSNTLNIPTVTLAGLGGAADSLVMHLAGSETATGYKTFSIGLQTNTGDNYLNYTSGATYIGYNAAPVGGYKLAVNGSTYLGNNITTSAIHTFQSNIGGGNIFVTFLSATGSTLGTITNAGLLTWSGTTSFTNTIGFNGKIGSSGTGGIAIVPGGVPSTLSVSQIMLLVSAPAGDYTSTYGLNEQGVFLGGTYNGGQGPSRLVLGPALYYNTGAVTTGVWDFSIAPASGQITDGYGSSLILQGGRGRGTGTPGKFIVQTSTATTTGTTLQTLSNRLEVDGIGQLKLNAYTSTSVFTGTLAGLLGFDASGNVITTASGVTGSGTAGQVTYWTGSSAVGGSSNLFWDNTNGRLGIGTSSPSAKLNIVESVTGNIVKFQGTLNTSLIFNNDSFGRAAIEVYGNTSATGQAGAYFNARGYEEAWFNVVANQASANNKWWRFGNLGIQNYFAIQKLLDNGNIGDTALTVFSSTTNIGLNTTTDVGYRLNVNGTGASTGALRVTGGLSLFQGGKMTIAAATTSYASLNIPSGTAPTTPANGDIWFDGTDIKMRIAGTTKTFTLI